jgi:outer membrane protein assembly factor BamB
MLRKALPITILVLALLVPAAPAGSGAQSSIALPAEFRPEGIASGKGDSFYVGSIPLGAVYRGSYRTGEGSVLVPPHMGRNHTGLKVDTRFDRLFVAGGASKAIYVYDAKTGADVKTFELPDAGFVNDVVLTDTAAYFTDSLVPQLYRVGIRPSGRLTEPRRVKYRGDLVFTEGFNANGIDAFERGHGLVVVKTNTGQLYRVSGLTGFTREIKLDEPVTNGDGILLKDDTLYVVQNQDNQVAVVKLDDDERSGDVRRVLTDPRLDVPTTIAPFKGFIYAVNARFGRPDDDDDDIVRLQDSRHR